MPSNATFIKEDIGFPVYALAWQDESTIVASGGGGAGKFGVKNKIVSDFFRNLELMIDCNENTRTRQR